MKLLRIARVPPVVVSPADTVQTAVEKMCDVGVGAVAVVDQAGRPVGIFTERDLMLRVVRPGRDPHETHVEKVMTRDPLVAPQEMEASDAFEFMTDKNFRHLPLTDHFGKLQGMLSVRHLMRHIVEHLSHELEGMNAYLGADAPGGD
ncbi:MAG: Inosine-5'-monophosphate dehydrogenase [bacterium]|nr:Inosine-5'-monophosphate dehydrogenase [bacterium]MCK6562002.1 CBS domain-containing protein [bacterium]NUM67433.1 CBS domain-containing protein [candidate division KSB1 bacterium]